MSCAKSDRPGKAVAAWNKRETSQSVNVFVRCPFASVSDETNNLKFEGILCKLHIDVNSEAGPSGNQLEK